MNIQKALVVDDSKVAHLALKKLLSERGIQVDWVGSGEDSIKYLEEKPSPDIVFMDIMMPGMGGFEATKAISNHPKISPPPIVMCSGNASERDQTSASQSGAVGFLAKPYTGDELDQILNKVQALSAAALAPATPAIDVESIVSRVEEAARKAAAEAIREMVEQTAQTLVEAARNTAAEEARQVAETTARGLMAESRVETEPSIDVEETARNVAAETARAVALETARAAAVESARSTAEQVARETAAQTARTVAEGVAAEAPTMVTTAPVDHNAIQQALEAAQQSLAARLQGQLEQRMDDALNRFAGSEDLRRRINQAAQDAAKPLVESAAREAAAQAARAAPAEGGSAAMGRANIALAAAVIALIAAIALPFVL